jgi:hypothetical protein
MRGGGSQSATNFVMRSHLNSPFWLRRRERSPPEIGHIMPERRERPAIGRDRIVGEVASHDLPQHFPDGLPGQGPCSCRAD